MSEEIRLGVPAGDEAVSLQVEELSVVQAVSPKVDVERVEGGVEITAEDYRGQPQSATLLDGRTPVKGEDYWTAADKEEIVSQATEATEADVADLKIQFQELEAHTDTAEYKQSIADRVAPITVIDDTAGDGDTDKTWSADKIVEELAGAGGGTVTDVQVGGVSVLDAQGVANVPVATSSTVGVVTLLSGGGIGLSGNRLYVIGASSKEIKGAGVSYGYKPIVPSRQHESAFYGLAKAAGDTTQSASSNPVGTYTDEAKTAIRTMLGAGEGDVKDVQVNGTSVVTDGVANVPISGSNRLGVVMVGNAGGLYVNPNNGVLSVASAASNEIKYGTAGFAYKPITPAVQKQSVFYGLAQAAGMNTTQDTLAVGQYTEDEKSAIQTMLGVEAGVSFVESVSGTAVTITGIANTRYKCGTVTTITITPPSLGTIVVMFTSGSTAAALTLPSTVKVPDWFDPTALDTDTTYELVITDGVYCGVMAWAE